MIHGSSSHAREWFETGAPEAHRKRGGWNMLSKKGAPRKDPPDDSSSRSSSSSSSSDVTGSSSGFSSGDDEDTNHNNSSSGPQSASSAAFSFDGHHVESANDFPADQERQILLLMLLAQVCSLHDPTPQMFTVHVLELFERGILDRESIRFLFDLGLVPTPVASPNNDAMLLLEGSQPLTNDGNDGTSPNALTLHHPKNSALGRHVLASNIRTALEHLDNESHNKAKEPKVHTVHDEKEATQDSAKRSYSSAWTVKSHPLSLSRFQREFTHVSYLAAGGFGSVFRATHKFDRREYAVKRVTFGAQGFCRDTVQDVVREVHCLAVCDHPHVVRYYTSWLEPNWMLTNSVSSSSSGPSANPAGNHNAVRQKLLTGLERMVSGDTEEGADEIRSFVNGRSKGRRRTSSLDGSSCRDEESSNWTSLSEAYSSRWSMEATSVDDLFLNTSGNGRANALVASPTWEQRRELREKRKKPSYKYQICLYLQMQLCHTTTLADWIRKRNMDTEMTLDSRIQAAAVIFRQISSGLAHVHQQKIIHRDIKPTNIFASCDNEVVFKIGDFGLSRLIQSATRTTTTESPMTGDVASNTLVVNTTLPGKISPYPLTAGVGTASYASPEQVSSATYTNAVDIFSLGLVLLELVCPFSTEHERLKTFFACRHRRVLPKELDLYPVARDIILRCTECKPSLRPLAKSLVDLDICQRSAVDPPPTDQSYVQDLEMQLQQKDEALQECRRILREKEVLINQLSTQLSQQPDPSS